MDKFAELLEKIEQFCLLTNADKVYGPYYKSNGRQLVIIKKDDGTSRTVSYPKFLVEQHLGRPLDPDLETIDHLDFNFDNNDISNLRVVPRDEHSADDTRRVKLIKLKCDMCGKTFERSPRLIRDRSKKGNTGNFCCKSCSGKYNRLLQLGKIKKLPVPKPRKSQYYRRKNIKAFVDYLFKKYSNVQRL